VEGFFAPAGTPTDRPAVGAGDAQRAAKDPRLLQLGIEPSGADPEEFAEVIRAERDFNRAAAVAAGIKTE
jgi:tripartite-type tricarboxylate transporter receptor subunit TctC